MRFFFFFFGEEKFILDWVFIYLFIYFFICNNKLGYEIEKPPFCQPIPTRVDILDRIIDISCGFFHTVVLSKYFIFLTRKSQPFICFMISDWRKYQIKKKTTTNRYQWTLHIRWTPKNSAQFNKSEIRKII